MWVGPNVAYLSDATRYIASARYPAAIVFQEHPTWVARTAWLASVAVGAALWMPVPGAAAADDPLPDRTAFLSQMRTRLRADSAILRRFAYTRSVVERTLDGEGRVTETHTRVFEVRPMPDDPEGHRWLTMKDGVPTSPAERQRLEGEYRTQLARAERRLAAETAAQRQRRLAREHDHAREQREDIDDLLSIYTLDLRGRETMHGVRTLLVTFAPRPGAQPRTRIGGFLKGVAGRAWFSEPEYELVRLEAEAVAPIRYGWGILARINEGSSAVLDRSPLPDGTWLPEQYAFVASGRVLLVRGIARRATVTFSNYRRMPISGIGE